MADRESTDSRAALRLGARRLIVVTVAVTVIISSVLVIILARAGGSPTPIRRSSGAAATRPAPGGRTAGVKPTTTLPLDRLAGQMVMAGMDGTWPSPELLETIRRGRIGGIILFSSNVTARLSSAIRVMQAAAHAGGNPPLLIAVDQEGGPIKRLEGPPSIAPRSIRDPQTAAAQGEMTARFLRLVGVNVDLAPVADVASSPRSFIAAEERGFAGQSRQVAVLASAFARGLQTGGVAATGKHFPGVGSVEVDTDTLLPTVAAPESQVDDGLVPFQQLISGGVDMIMVASAVYPTLDRSAAPAVFSPAIVNGLLRQQLGFRGVIITDALDTPAQLGGTPGERAVRAITAGADIALLAAPQYGPQAVRSLIDAVQAGVLSRSRLEASYAHVVTLKEHVAAIGARAAATN